MLPIPYDYPAYPKTNIEYIDSRYIKNISNDNSIEKINRESLSVNAVSSENVDYLKDKIMDEFLESFQLWKQELIEEEEFINSSNEINDVEKSQVKTEADRRRANVKDSFVVMKNFLDSYKEMFTRDFLPAVSVDDDGEISFEWYGRLGSRALLTFGQNKDLFFISLLRGKVFKYQLPFQKDIPTVILSNLKKIYKDKSK